MRSDEDRDLSPFEPLWTNRRDDYVLLRGSRPEDPLDLLVVDITSERFEAMLIDDDRIADAVVRNMLAAGVPAVTFEELKERFPAK